MSIATLASINPATGETIRQYSAMPTAQVSQLLASADKAFLAWKRRNFAERSLRMRAAASQLRARVEEYARLMALEMGKPLPQGRAEIAKCAVTCEYYADNAQRFLSPEPVATDAAKSFVAFEPLGVVLAVMPWNFPFWQVFRAASAALMAGNAMVLKHASNVSGCAVAIESVFRGAGFPEGLFATLLITTQQVSAVLEQPLVKAVTLTGSTQAGQRVASQAAALLKKSVLELGGSDPYVVLADADVEQAAQICVASRLINSGQSCIAAKRFIVEEPVRKQFEELFVELMRSKKMGDPLKEGTDVGPLARHDLRDSLHDQVKRSVASGAKLALGGVIPDSKGAYYPPTVLTQVEKGTAAYDEETFGPVAAIIAATDEEQAIRLANNSIYGLGAAVFTQDRARGERIAAERIEAGSCFVNASVHSDPRLPFGGVKQSGYGRELSSFGIREFVNVKSVYIK